MALPFLQRSCASQSRCETLVETRIRSDGTVTPGGAAELWSAFLQSEPDDPNPVSNLVDLA